MPVDEPMNRTIISPSIFLVIGLLLVASRGGVAALAVIPGLQPVLFYSLAALFGIELVSDVGQTFARLRCYWLAEPLLRISVAFRSLGMMLPGSYATALCLADRGVLEFALCEQQKYAQALAVNKKNLKIARMKFGGDSRPYVDELVNRSYILGSMGAPEAEDAAREAIVVLNELECRSQTECESLCSALNNLAVVMINSGNRERGMELFDKAFALKRAYLKPDDPSMVASYANHGYALTQVKQYEEAEKALRKALELSKNPRITDELRATIQNNLGDALVGQGKLDEAESHLLASLKTRERVHTKTHPFMAYSYHNMAKLRREQGNLSESEDYFKKALAIRERIPGANNMELNETLMQFRQLLKKQERLTEADAIAEAHGLPKE